MSNFLPNRIKDLNGWIPETDIDGLDVDARKGVVSETENIVFENGFFRTQTKPTSFAMPFTPTATEEILDVTTFYHTVRGTTWVYLIWNSDTTMLYVYIKDDEGYSGYLALPHTVTFDNKPDKAYINYAEYNNQLKINTN